MLSSYNQKNCVTVDRSSYSSKRLSRKTSAFIFTVTVITHGVVIIVVLNNKLKQQEHKANEPVIQFIQLSPEKYLSPNHIEKPLVIFRMNAIRAVMPEINVKDLPANKADLTNYHASEPYEFPTKNSELFPDVFNPVLRKKLQEVHTNRRPKQNTINTWETSGGSTFVDMGDGGCIASMPNIDSRRRGTSWSMLRVKCGKTDSEKMMDNVTADLEARKHPLKAQ